MSLIIMIMSLIIRVIILIMGLLITGYGATVFAWASTDKWVFVLGGMVVFMGVGITIVAIMWLKSYKKEKEFEAAYQQYLLDHRRILDTLTKEKK